MKPGSIDEKIINMKPKTPFHALENHNTMLNETKKLGLNFVNIGAADLSDKQPHLILGLIWQILKVLI